MTWVVALALLGGCFIDRRSSELACDVTADCAPGRTCSGGYCVVVDAGSSCPAACTLAGGTCSTPTTCRFTCNSAGSCAQPIMCPPGMACAVTCNAPNACAGGIACGSASDCDVTCSSTSACAGPILCGAARCDVTCSGQSACGGGVSCLSSCRCDVNCSGNGACQLPAQCRTGCEDAPGCKPTPASSCDTCP